MENEIASVELSNLSAEQDRSREELEELGISDTPEGSVDDKEFQEITEVALQNEINTASKFMGPGQLATLISSNLDTQYLKELVVQLTNNSNGR